ncbi:MAG: hypothetical protein HYY03_01235 [Chloroflexi bacterium]|nr:hypothetical protein [Chloroflexota bacterium]
MGWLTASQVFGFAGHQAAFNTKYGTAGSKLDSCTTCHLADFSGKNPYGLALVAQGGGDINVRLAAVESLDSDGDGVSNIAEINARTWPGDAADYPSIQDQLGACLAVTNIAWSLNNQTKAWSSFDPDLPPALQSLTQLVSRGGYFVNTSADCTITIGADSILLYTGWNLFGWP